MRQYSRLIATEEKRNIRKAFLFIALAIAAGIALLFLGIPLLGKFAAFVSELGKSNKEIVSDDRTPPAPPKFKTFPDFTNQTQVSLEGTAETGVTIKLTFNGEDKETVADSGGNFSFSLTLKEGENNFKAIATDTSGNVSQESQDGKIVFDKKSPDLTIDTPSQGAQFFGSKQRQITIRGTSEAEVQITINDRIVAVDAEGKFQYTTTLSEGENKFMIKAMDAAGNSVEQELVLQFIT